VKKNPIPHSKREPREKPLSHMNTNCKTSHRKKKIHLTTETVEGAALALEGVDDVEGGDSLALGMLGVGNGITDDTLEEGLKNTTGLLVNHCLIDVMIRSIKVYDASKGTD
jgi:hypothetical protein